MQEDTQQPGIKLEAVINLTLAESTDVILSENVFTGSDAKIVLEGEFFTVATDARSKELIKKNYAKKA